MDDNQMIIKPSKRTQVVEEYYFSTKLKEIESMKKDGADVINLGVGSPDLPPSEATIEELISMSPSPKIHGYQSYNGIFELRDAFSKWYKAYMNVTLDPNSEILPLMGSKEGIMHISMAFLDDGDSVLIPDPGYPTYTSATKLAGADVKYYKLNESNNYLPNLKEIEESDLSKVKIMWINYPHMPSGKKANLQDFQRIVDFGIKHSILICHDNPYSFILNDTPLSIFEAKNSRDIAIELNSLSKSHNMPGWRIGMVGAKMEYISAILKIKSNMDSGMFKPMQLAAVKALKESPEWYKKNNSIYKERREYVEQIFDLLECTYDKNQTGLFLWGRVPKEYKDGDALSDFLLKSAYIFITPGKVFGKEGNDYVRISLCADKSLLESCLNRIKTLK